MDDPSACPCLYTDGLSDELPFFAQARPRRMIRLQYKSAQCFILYDYFNGAFTSPLAACSVNNKGCEENAIMIITKISHHFPNAYFQVTLRFHSRSRRC